jgi:hypothetical protein
VLHFGRQDDERTQTVTLSSSTQTLVRIYRPGALRLYATQEVRHRRGPSVEIGDGSAVPTVYDLTPAGAGDAFAVTRRDIARQQRLDGEHFVEISVWDASGGTARFTFEPA